MEKQILRLFCEQLSDDNLTLKSNYKAHPLWSSLRALVLISEIELQTNVLISAETLRHCETIATLSQEIAKLQPAK